MNKICQPHDVEPCAGWPAAVEEQLLDRAIGTLADGQGAASESRFCNHGARLSRQTTPVRIYSRASWGASGATNAGSHRIDVAPAARVRQAAAHTRPTPAGCRRAGRPARGVDNRPPRRDDGTRGGKPARDQRTRALGLRQEDYRHAWARRRKKMHAALRADERLAEGDLEGQRVWKSDPGAHRGLAAGGAAARCCRSGRSPPTAGIGRGKAAAVPQSGLAEPRAALNWRQ